jgi:5-methylcytosine-specific restriction protein A
VHTRRDADRAYNQQRGPDRQFYSTDRWRRFRAWFLDQHPVCVMCEEQGVAVPATEVDHIKSRREFPELAFEESNCRACCKPCHSSRTAREQGFGRRRGGI